MLAYFIGRDIAWDTQVMGWLNTVRGKARSGVHAPTAWWMHASGWTRCASSRMAMNWR